MSDWFEQRQIERKEAYRKRRRRDRIVGLVGALLLVAAAMVGFLNRGEGNPTQTRATGSPANQGESSSPALSLPTSQGITQAQLDRLGDSIQARYRSGDTEIAQALLDNFMDDHPECVSAVVAGGEGKRVSDIRESAEEAARYLRSTAPYSSAYTTVITNRVDGLVKAAVLGVSCKEA